MNCTRRFILAFVFLMALSSHICASAKELYTAPPTFSEIELQLLENIFQNKDFNFSEFSKIIDELPSELVSKIKVLGSSEHLLYDSRDLKLFNQHHPDFASTNKLELLRVFIHELAMDVIAMAKDNKNYELRLLARDMGPVYRHVEWLLQQKENPLNLSNQEKLEILSRIDYVYASRNVISSLKTSAEAEALLNIDSRSNKKYILLDAGFSGSIPKTLEPLLKTFTDQGSIEWRFVWRSPNAPLYIGLWGQNFFLKVEELFRSNDIQRLQTRSEVDSFRVALFEHLPKTLGSFNEHSSVPVYLMLDIDDTVLKEVDYNKYRGHKDVQILEYSPSADVLEKYKERLHAPADANKVIHYDIGADASFKSSVTVRPGFKYLLQSIEGYVRSGQIRIVVTSNNDFQRTNAVYKQLKIDGATLEERGATVLSPDSFNNQKKNKDMSLVRRLIGINGEPHVIAVDDLPERIEKSVPNDHIFPVSAFAGPHVQQSLHPNTPFENLLLEDMRSMKHLLEMVRRNLMVNKDIPLMDKIKGLAVFFNVFSSSENNKTSSSSSGGVGSMCRSLFMKDAS